jgi:hypothetical protein
MNPSAKLSELVEALEFESEESVTRFDRQTGRIVSVDRHILSAFPLRNQFVPGAVDGEPVPGFATNAGRVCQEQAKALG